MWLQSDGAPPHYHCEVRSPDLTPLDFFLWGT
ncbi:hypothetical protein D910_04290 [Dendroctonus ponderosae]|uniref:Uncharacterized protein n=1 Tax=Dendroctonus ponderosae TaxID=77166 RepID=U4U1F8_DENPD|nr:hypothetical protein D910_04290 [Dendroctonus ponderosae]